MPSDYVVIKTFIKCDPLLVQLLYQVFPCYECYLEALSRHADDVSMQMTSHLMSYVSSVMVIIPLLRSH